MPSYESQSGASAPPGYAGNDDNDNKSSTFSYSLIGQGDAYNGGLVGTNEIYNIRDLQKEIDRRREGYGTIGGYGDTGGNPVPTPATPAPQQWLDPAKTKHQPIQMGGTPTGNYNTSSPTYSDLMAKHQSGFNNPETGETEVPNMFNLNGTVYSFNPESSAYKDTYTGNEITQDNGQTGSLGIEGIYGRPGAYQRDMGGATAMANPDPSKRLNPAYTAHQAEQEQQAAQQAAQVAAGIPANAQIAAKNAQIDGGIASLQKIIDDQGYYRTATRTHDRGPNTTYQYWYSISPAANRERKRERDAR